MSEEAAQEAALGLLNLSPANSTLSPSLIPAKRKQDLVDLDAHWRDGAQTEAISCICGYTHDDGFQIGCESCPRWAHAMCFGIGSANVPEKWYCWKCRPRQVNRERAAKDQREYLRTLAAETGGYGQSDRRRRTSPGTDRKSRKSSSMKRKVLEEEQQHVDIMTEDEPWKFAHVREVGEEVPRANGRSKPRQIDHGRRDAPSISVYDLIHPTHTSPRDYARQPPVTTPRPSYSSIGHGRPFSLGSNAPTHPPAQRLPSPQALLNSHPPTRLADPLDSYAHLGMPKPIVNLTGPLSDMTRVEHPRSRSRQQPNAILRPIMCRQSNSSHGDPQTSSADALAFGIFAVRDLRANEEVVLGWEWDDGHALHSLPAAIEAPAVFPKTPSNVDSRFPLHDQPQFRTQMNNVLHTFSSSFTTCACGSQSRECALSRMEGQGNAESSRVSEVHHSSRKNTYHSADAYDDSPPNILVSPASPERRIERGNYIPQQSWASELEDPYYPQPQPTAPLPPPGFSQQYRPHMFSDSRSISPRSTYSPDLGDRYAKDLVPHKIRKVWRQRDSDSTSPSESGTTPSERSHSHPMEIDEGLHSFKPPSHSHGRYGAISTSPTAPFSKLSLVSPVTVTGPAALPRIQEYYSPAQDWAPIKRRDAVSLREEIEPQSVSASRLGSPARHISFPSSSERFSPLDIDTRTRREEYSPLDGLAEAACKASAALASSTEQHSTSEAVSYSQVEDSANRPAEAISAEPISTINDYEHPITIEMVQDVLENDDEDEDEDENVDESQETDIDEDIPMSVSGDVEMVVDEEIIPLSLHDPPTEELPTDVIASESLATEAIHPLPPPSPSPSPQSPDVIASPVAEVSTESTIPTVAVAEPEPTEEPAREPTPELAREPTPEPAKESIPEPVEEPTPEPVREPTPPPPPKKLSLKDFAALKRKRREEEALKHDDVITEAPVSHDSAMEASSSEQEVEQVPESSSTGGPLSHAVTEEVTTDITVPESASILDTASAQPDEGSMAVDVTSADPVPEPIAEPYGQAASDPCPSSQAEESQKPQPPVAAPPQIDPVQPALVETVPAPALPDNDTVMLQEPVSVPESGPEEEVEAGEVTESDMKSEQVDSEPQPPPRSPSPLPAKPEALIIFPPRSNGIGNPDRPTPAKYSHYSPPSRPHINGVSPSVSRFDNAEMYRPPSSSRFDYEDGEITSGPSSSVAAPRKSYPPPTGPRSFNPPSGPSSTWKKPISATTHNGRPPPTGPRSLRTGVPPPARSMRLSPTSSSYIPRGPSSDRDRDRLDSRRIGRAGASWNAR